MLSVDDEEGAGAPPVLEQRPRVPDRSKGVDQFNKQRKRIQTEKRQGQEARGETVQESGQEETDQQAGAEQAVQLTDLRNRVAELEVEVARLRPEAGATPRAMPRSRQIPLTPPYVARAVVAVEDHLQDMERFAATGDEIAAQQAKVAAATRCCVTLRRLCDDDDFLQMLVAMRKHLEELRSSNTSGSIEGDIQDQISTQPFRDTEVQLLQLSGLPESSARNHVDTAITAYIKNPASALERLADPMAFLSELRKLRDSSCLTAELLSQSIRQQQTRQRLKKLLTFGLSGTLIVIVNGVGTAVLGPVGVAASQALGSAALGVAAQFLS
jgi:hypothetical protein